MEKSAYSYCHYCGHTMTAKILTQDGYRCISCNQVMWLNAIPVAVLIAPYGNHKSGRQHGVFAVRRGIQPFVGQLALPGGFMTHTKEVQETWQQAACRETQEEINILCDTDVTHILTESSYSEKTIGDRVLIVGVTKKVHEIKEFKPNIEAQERTIIFPDDQEQLCFPIHRKALALYWDGLGVEHHIKN